MNKIIVCINYNDALYILNQSILTYGYTTNKNIHKLLFVLLRCYFGNDDYKYNKENNLYNLFKFYGFTKSQFISTVSEVSQSIIFTTYNHLPYFKSYRNELCLDQHDLTQSNSAVLLIRLTHQQFLLYSSSDTALF